MDETVMHSSQDMSPKEMLEEMRAFQRISTQFAESASELVAVSMRIHMLVMEDMRAGLGEIADVVSASIRDRRSDIQPED